METLLHTLLDYIVIPAMGIGCAILAFIVGRNFVYRIIDGDWHRTR